MKQFVRLLSADPSSTDTTVFTTSTGDAHQTIIRAPFAATAPAGNLVTVTATNLESFVGLTTEIAGFSIASPLLGDPATGPINPNAIAVAITNSNVLIDKDYIVDAGVGIAVTTSGTTPMNPSIENDGIIGNAVGMAITDGGLSAGTTVNPVNVINNDFAFNTIGLELINSATSPIQAYVASNIFWENHDQTLARSGFAIFSTNANKINMRNNLFFGNGASESSQAGAVNTVQNGFSSANLGTTAQDAINNLGNFVGNPSFVFPIDPRPGSDGPANFFLEADFQVTAASAAIDNAWEPTAITTDLLGNSQVKITNGGFGLAGYGPRDIGAFEFNGTGGTPLGGGAFRVLSTSLVPIAGEFKANGQTVNVASAPTSVTVTFSSNVNPSDINATDLVLSGTALSVLAPAHATSLTWIDAHTVKFNLSGQFNTSGTLAVSLAANTIGSNQGTSNMGYSDSSVLSVGGITPPSNPGGGTGTGTGTGTGPGLPGNPSPAPAPSPAPTPKPAPAPKGPLHHHKKPVTVHKKVVKHIAPPKHPVAKPKAPAPKHGAVAPKNAKKK
jgi:hypothetical protein